MSVAVVSNKLITTFLVPACLLPNTTFSTLPNNVLKQLILRYLSREDKIPVSFVCKQFKVLCAAEKQPRRKEHGSVLLVAMRKAAGEGCDSLLAWYHCFLRCPWDESISTRAAQSNQLSTLQWLRSQGCPWDEDTCRAAAKKGHLQVLQWALENKCPWIPSIFIHEIAQGGHLEILQWGYSRGYLTHILSYVSAMAAKEGHLEIVKWAVPLDNSSRTFICSAAAVGGKLEVLRWARANGCTWDEGTCSSAAANGHLEVLKWARANGCPWNERTCTNAASGGHLEVLQWARANGCPWDKYTWLMAAACVKPWLWAHGASA